MAAFQVKPHYLLLDALRGVAALLVMWYHVFEAFATSPFDQRFNHGYLAVDFFFVLSGFVIGYAYDDRWGKMSTTHFFKRRLIRLHPMVVAGALIGLIAYMAQGCVTWNGTPVDLQWVAVAWLLSMFLLPTFPGMASDVRGNGEMFPLNGPSWSLFFEYIGNILYALFIRRLSTRWLCYLVALSAIGVVIFATGFSEYGSLGVGWTMGGNNFLGGMLRLMFSYSMGLLLSRLFAHSNDTANKQNTSKHTLCRLKSIKVKGIFWWCSLVLVILFSIPHVGGEQHRWMNGLYDSFCVLLVFPAIVCFAAAGSISEGSSRKVCKFLGDISYPVYMVHYPFMYLFYAWVWKNELTFPQTWHIALTVIAVSILTAYIILKCYDEPMRKQLTQRWLRREEE